MFNKGKKLFRVEIKVHGRIVYLLDSIYTRFYSLLISIFPSFCINFSIFVFQIIDNTMVKKNFLMTAPFIDGIILFRTGETECRTDSGR